MANPPGNDNESTEKPLKLDLSELQNLDFGPDWSGRKQADIPKNLSERGDRPGKGSKAPRRDRRPRQSTEAPQRHTGGAGAEPARPEHGDRQTRRPSGVGFDRERREQRGGRSFQGGPRERGGRPQEFQPVVDVSFYPEDLPFKALCHAMRTNCRTYELFELARLILEKPERFVATVKPLERDDAPIKEFFVSVPDNIPFETEDEAVAHVMANNLETFFEVKEVEVDPPKGNFAVVSKCGITGELIGPPNYHRYQALLQAHHSAKVSNVSFERFQSRLESVRDEEAIAAWTASMSKQTHYLTRVSDKEEAEAFDNRESAKYFLLTKRRDKVVRASNQIRVSGQMLENLPQGALRRSIESVLDYQRRFPLETANNLRGRLRRLKFTIYKKGSKGVSFVCAVKRRFRDPSKRFSDSIQKLITFIEDNPEVKVSELPGKFLGIKKPESRIDDAAESAPEIESVDKEKAAAIVEAHEIKRQERLASESDKPQTVSEEPASSGEQVASGDEIEPVGGGAEVADGNNTDAAETFVETSEVSETSEASGDDAPIPQPDAALEAKPEPDTPEADTPVTEPVSNEVEKDAGQPRYKVDDAPGQKAMAPVATDKLVKPLSESDHKIRAMMNSLRWLVTEGYVTEFGDGRLFAQPTADASHNQPGTAVATSKPSVTNVDDAADSASTTAAASSDTTEPPLATEAMDPDTNIGSNADAESNAEADESDSNGLTAPVDNGPDESRSEA